MTDQATWIALLRGVNVGGHNTLPMKPLAAALTARGLGAVRTFIQSGNIVFTAAADRSADALATDLRGWIAADCGVDTPVYLLTAAELLAALDANPYPQAAADPKSLHLIVLGEPPTAVAMDALIALLAADEALHLSADGRILYFYAPSGIGKSKAMARLDRSLKVPFTARNLRTCMTLATMAVGSG